MFQYIAGGLFSSLQTSETVYLTIPFQPLSDYIPHMTHSNRHSTWHYLVFIFLSFSHPFRRSFPIFTFLLLLLG